MAIPVSPVPVRGFWDQVGDHLTGLVAAGPEVVAWAVLATVVAAACLLVGWVVKRFAGAGAEDLLTLVAAGVASAVSVNGMWRFCGDVLKFEDGARVALCAFIELAMFVSGLRARRNLRDKRIGRAGADGVAMWAFTALSAVLSALDSDSVPEIVLRLAAPVVAAWLWERAMAPDKVAAAGLPAGGQRTIRFKWTWERLLVAARVAERVSRTADQADTQQRLARLAHAVRIARDLTKATSWWGRWRSRRAERGVDRSMLAAVEGTDLATDTGVQGQLMGTIGALFNGRSLISMNTTAPWMTPAEQTELASIRQQLEAERAAHAAELTALGERLDQVVQQARVDHDQVVAELQERFGRDRAQLVDQVAAAGATHTELVQRVRAAEQRAEAADARLVQVQESAAAQVARLVDQAKETAGQVAGLREQLAASAAVEQSALDRLAELEASRDQVDLESALDRLGSTLVEQVAAHLAQSASAPGSIGGSGVVGGPAGGDMAQVAPIPGAGPVAGGGDQGGVDPVVELGGGTGGVEPAQSAHLGGIGAAAPAPGRLTVVLDQVDGLEGANKREQFLALATERVRAGDLRFISSLSAVRNTAAKEAGAVVELHPKTACRYLLEAQQELAELAAGVSAPAVARVPAQSAYSAYSAEAALIAECPESAGGVAPSAEAAETAPGKNGDQPAAGDGQSPVDQPAEAVGGTGVTVVAEPAQSAHRRSRAKGGRKKRAGGNASKRR